MNKKVNASVVFMGTYDIFISYRRIGGFETAAYLYNLLIADNYTVSFDVDNLRSGRFDHILLERIDKCKDFIVILDRNAFQRTLEGNDLSSDWLRLELGRAIEKKKNIIPVFLEGYVHPAEESLPEDIAPITRYSGYAYNREYFRAFYDKIKKNLISVPQNTQSKTDEVDDVLIEETIRRASYGDLNSQISLGKYYWDKEDYSRSGAWYSMAAEQGDGRSKFLLACLMLNGKISYHKKTVILELLQEAAEQNIVESYPIIAVWYMNGYDGKRDYQKALSWLQKASSVGENDLERMAICLQNLGRYEESLHLWKLEASKDNPVALYHCGAFYFNGWGCKQDFQEAKRWFEKSASSGNIKALHGLACIYFEGLGVEQDEMRGIELYKQAGDMGYTESYARLGTIYMDIYNDMPNSIKYYELAAKQGHAIAQFNMGVLLCEGRYLEQNFHTAATYFFESAKQGNHNAQKMLGQLYEKGIGVPQDKENAKKWYALAAGDIIEELV